ncbi:MAG: ABC-2 family transporter protein, partial [Desulfobacteraceae bacterium]|nr:ABC-2 family transporter protein [Desulfobacteraceae bacterium]
SIWLMMVTSAFWFVRIDNISELFSAIYETGRFPVSVYPSWMRGVLTFVVPIAFITTFPAAALLGRAAPLLLAVAFVLAAGLFCGCVLFWRFAVRRYSSASS